MKITDVRVVIHERELPHGVFPRPTMPIGVVTISTDEGIDGHVFLSPPGVDVAPQLVSAAKPMLVGRDPLDIGAIWHEFAARSRMFDPGPLSGIRVVDVGTHVAGPRLDRIWSTLADPGTAVDLASSQ